MIQLHVRVKAAHQDGALPLRVPVTRTRDSGAATTTILVVGMVLVLSLLFMLILPLTRGADQASQSQNAADAAALAGAKEIKRTVLDGLASGNLLVLTGPWASRGSTEASNYATRNGASLIQYSYDAYTDEVRAHIRFDTAGVEGTARVERPAVAELGVALMQCEITTDELEPEPEPEPSPTETEPVDPDDEDEDPLPPPPPPRQVSSMASHARAECR